MTLPVINAPKSETTLPSSGIEVEFRPFLVKEEKLLIIASESEDNKEIELAVRQVIDQCTYGKVDARKLAKVDFEWLLLQMRAKAKGKAVEVSFKCKAPHPTKHAVECGHVTECHSSTDEVRYVANNEKDVIQITENIGMKMKQPTIMELEGTSESDDELDKMFELIYASVESVYHGEEVTYVKDLAAGELQEFIEQMNNDQFAKIKAYVENQPKLVLDIDFVCEKCGSKETIELTGIEDFFV